MSRARIDAGQMSPAVMRIARLRALARRLRGVGGSVYAQLVAEELDDVAEELAEEGAQ